MLQKLQNPYFGASLMVMMRMIVVKMMIMLIALNKPPCLSSKLAARCTIITIIICNNSSRVKLVSSPAGLKGKSARPVIYSSYQKTSLQKRKDIKKENLFSIIMGWVRD